MFRAFYIPYVLYGLNCREFVLPCETIALCGKMLEKFSGCLTRNSNNSWCGYETASPQHAQDAELCIKFLYGLYATDNLVYFEIKLTCSSVWGPSFFWKAGNKMTRHCPQTGQLMWRAQLVLKGLFNSFVTLYADKSGGFFWAWSK